MTSAEEVIGCARKKQPGWLIDATDVLAPLLDDEARTCQKYLRSLCSTAKKDTEIGRRRLQIWINKMIGDAEHSEDEKLWQD